MSLTEAEKLALSRMSPEKIMEGWRPGSYDKPWTWKDECLDIWAQNIEELMADINVNGIKEPVILGDDGRVWEGHHRICIAYWLSLPEVPYEMGTTNG